MEKIEEENFTPKTERKSLLIGNEISVKKELKNNNNNMEIDCDLL